ncbi:MAG: hypothetical protein IJ849_05785 [Selenomonadaceae bacterium]|nr:hypothetical protein [Selenomonadaceae bacterium]
MALSAEDKAWIVEVMKTTTAELATAVNQRFEATDKKIGDLREEVNQRFDATDKKIDATNTKIDATDKKIDDLREEVREERKVHIQAEQEATKTSLLMVKNEAKKNMVALDERVTKLEAWQDDVTDVCQRHRKIA